MSGIFGALNLNDNDRSFVNVIGQRLVFDAVQDVLTRFNEDLRQAYSIFVEETTEDFKRRYLLPGGGYLQRRGGSAQSAAVKGAGKWDIALPLEDFGAQVAENDIAIAYMNMQQLNRHLDTVTMQSINTMRREILKAVFNNTVFSFNDPINGTLAVQPLANGDSVTFPPKIGNDSEATENHYFGLNYVSASISDTNNPYITIRDHLEEHFGAATGYENIVVFINNAETAKTQALAAFDEVPDRFLIPSINRDVPTGLPVNLPGRVLGRCSGVWVVEWRFVPAGYMFGTYVEDGVPKPLIQRVDPADTGLPTGLTLVGSENDTPFIDAHYRHRYGFGAGNRLNGVCAQLVASTSYTIPTALTR